MVSQILNAATDDPATLLQKARQGDIDAMGKVLRGNKNAFADFEIRRAWNRVMVYGSRIQGEQLMRSIVQQGSQDGLAG